MERSPSQLDTPLYNSRIYDTYIKLIRKEYPHVDVTELLRHAGIEMHQVEDEGHDPTDREGALQLALTNGMDNGRLATGVFYKSDRPAFEDSLVQLQEKSLIDQQSEDVDVGKLMEAKI